MSEATYLRNRMLWTSLCTFYHTTDTEGEIEYNTRPIAHDDESPAGKMNSTQNSIEALHRRILFGHKVRPDVVPWPEEHRVMPL